MEVTEASLTVKKQDSDKFGPTIWEDKSEEKLVMDLSSSFIKCGLGNQELHVSLWFIGQNSHNLAQTKFIFIYFLSLLGIVKLR